MVLEAKMHQYKCSLRFVVRWVWDRGNKQTQEEAGVFWASG